MIMLSDWHPDILEFIISKMQNPKILHFIIENTKDKLIKQTAKNKLSFKPLTEIKTNLYKSALKDENIDTTTKEIIEKELTNRGRHTVNNPDFLSGANISVCLTKDFMEAVENDAMYDFRFPDTENYTNEEMEIYNKEWHICGDVREWKERGFGVKVYHSIKARELWNLISICATYSAEPGIFFIDNANDMTNAVAYGQKVVATNPCGEQPLSPYSVCNLSALNLANMADKKTKQVNYDKLIKSVKTAVRMQDNVIDATPYFLEDNKIQAKGERRIGLGVMGLADLLIYCEKVYGSEEGNQIVDKVFEVIATTAYETSIELAIEKGSFPFLIGESDTETNVLRGKFINSGYMKKMPEHIRKGVLEYGIRNSFLLTVAPTGSTGSMVGCATGLEPYFAFKYYRSGRLGKFMEVNSEIVQEYLNNNPNAVADNLPEWFVSAMELPPEAHADVQCIIQRWVDSSISKTVNAPKGYGVEDVQKLYERLHKGGAKGGTVYVDGSRDAQVLSLTAEDNNKNDSEQEKSKVFLVNTVTELKSTNVNVGNEVGDTCPICRKGKVIDAGGCNTCNNCNAQLKCGL